MTNLEKNILKELDRQGFSARTISVVMKKLNTSDKKNSFLSYLIGNRNVLLSDFDLINYIKEEIMKK